MFYVLYEYVQIIHIFCHFYFVTPSFLLVITRYFLGVGAFVSWLMMLLRWTYGVVFSSKPDEVDVDGRIDRCFTRHKTVNPAPYNGENQPERLEADVLWRLWPYSGT